MRRARVAAVTAVIAIEFLATWPIGRYDFLAADIVGIKALIRFRLSTRRERIALESASL